MELPDRVVEQIPRLRRYARALLRGNTPAADDLVQDCLERALGRLHFWRSGSDLRAWLFTIMHNLYVNQLRRNHSGPQFVELLEEESTVAAPGGAESATTLRELQRALDGLPAEQREVLLLVALEGLRYQEAATILGIPVGTVMSRLARARQQLRQQLAQERDGPLRRVK